MLSEEKVHVDCEPRRGYVFESWASNIGILNGIITTFLPIIYIIALFHNLPIFLLQSPQKANLRVAKKSKGGCKTTGKSSGLPRCTRDWLVMQEPSLPSSSTCWKISWFAVRVLGRWASELEGSLFGEHFANWKSTIDGQVNRLFLWAMFHSKTSNFTRGYALFNHQFLGGWIQGSFDEALHEPGQLLG